MERRWQKLAAGSLNHAYKAQTGTEIEVPTGMSLLLSITLFLIGIAHAGTSPAFQGDDFGQCAVKYIRSRMTPEEIKSRLEHADKVRTSFGQQALAASGGSYLSGPLSGVLRKVMPFSDEDSSEVMGAHSFPLIDFTKYGNLEGYHSHNNLGRVQQLIQKYRGDSTTDLTTVKDFNSFLNQKVPASDVTIGLWASEPDWIKVVAATQILSDRFVDYLASGHEKFSLTPWQLFKNTTELYDGDPLTALGIIGSAFDTERVSDGTYMPLDIRNKRLYLGSRLKPIYTDSVNPMGDNYHFWLYMDAGIQGKSGPAERMAYTYQTITRDFQELRADRVGLAAGAYIRKHLLDADVSTIKCTLDDSIPADRAVRTTTSTTSGAGR